MNEKKQANLTDDEKKELDEFINRLVWDVSISHTAVLGTKILDDMPITVALNVNQNNITLSPYGAIRLIENSNEMMMTSSITIAGINQLGMEEIRKHFRLAILHLKYHVFRLHKENEVEKKRQEEMMKLRQKEASETISDEDISDDEKAEILRRAREERLKRIRDEKE